MEDTTVTGDTAVTGDMAVMEVTAVMEDTADSAGQEYSEEWVDLVFPTDLEDSWEPDAVLFCTSHGHLCPPQICTYL